MQRITDLPNHSRPREKLFEKGASALKDAELLAIVLGAGFQGSNAIQLAEKILKKHPLKDLCSLPVSELLKIKGLGPSKAASITASLEIIKRKAENNLPKITSAEDVVKISSFISKNKREHFITHYLDARHQLLATEVISIGTLTEGLVHPREVFVPAIKNHAASVIIAHNHPSGDPSPSESDIKVTQRLEKAGIILGIELIDHVIVTPTQYYSFKQNSEGD